MTTSHSRKLVRGRLELFFILDADLMIEIFFAGFKRENVYLYYLTTKSAKVSKIKATLQPRTNLVPITFSFTSYYLCAPAPPRENKQINSDHDGVSRRGAVAQGLCDVYEFGSYQTA